MSSDRTPIEAAGAPAAVGPYVHAVAAAGLVFLSGQVALDPQSGQLIGTTAAQQAQQCLKNLRTVAAAAGCDLATDAVRCTVLLTDIDDFAAVNDVYATYFTAAGRPARVAYAVSALPKGALVEIDAVLAGGSNGPPAGLAPS